MSAVTRTEPGPDRAPAPAEPSSRRRRRRRRRGVSFWVGALLTLGGLAALAWIAWQLIGTNVVSGRQQAATVEKLEREWAKPRAEAAADVAAPAGRAYAIMRIPRFGDDYEIPILETVEYDVLAQGYGHFEQSAEVGQVGNYALAAHRRTRNEPLRNMPELQVGDELVIETRDAFYTYVLDTGGEDLRVPFTSGWVVDRRPENPDPDGVDPTRRSQRLITIMTCAELFSGPDRLVAFGHLERVESRDGDTASARSPGSVDRARPG